MVTIKFGENINVKEVSSIEKELELKFMSSTNDGLTCETGLDLQEIGKCIEASQLKFRKITITIN